MWFDWKSAIQSTKIIQKWAETYDEDYTIK